MTTAPERIESSRRAGAAYISGIERDKDKRARARSFRPLTGLWPFVARYPGRLTAFLIFLALSSLMSLSLSFILRGMVDCGFGGTGAPAYCLALQVDELSRLNSFFIIAIMFVIVFAMVGSVRAYLINTLGERVVADLRCAVFSHLVRLSPAYFERVRTGEILSRLTTDTTLVETVVTGSISFALRSIAQTVGALLLMFIVSWKLSLMVLAIGPLIIVPAVIVGRRIRKLSRDGQDSLAGASARAGESLSGIRTVQAFTRESFEADAFAREVENTFSLQKRRLLVRAFLMTFIMGAAMSAIAGIIWFGAHSVQTGQMEAGAIVQFAFLAFMAGLSTGMLSETWTNLLRAAGAAERLSEILAEKPDIDTPETPAKLQRAGGLVDFANVSFSYPTRPGEKALDDVSFAIRPGETVALVGPSGAGKSTVFQLLLRFYDPQSGSIRIDEYDLATLSPKDLRRQFAIVQQNTPLFSGSAMDNIRYGRSGASDDEVVAVARAAYADAFIRRLPDGYDTDLGERALTLSGGQQQRIAIARAILRDAPILLLDEATSALDAHSERAVQQAFAALSDGRTTLVIAHRLATVLRADRILVFDQGRLVDQGTHDELLRRGGLYAELAELQFLQDTA